MKETTVIVQNVHGIHCRPSSVIVKECKAFKSKITAHKGGQKASLSSILELISLALHAGEEVRLECEGPDEDAALAKVAELFAHHFDYPDKA